MNEKSKFSIKDITVIGVFAALVIVASKIEVPLGESRIHLGNVVCLLAGFVLNPIPAGLSAGIGSLFYDLIFYGNGLSCIITFINKFLMAFVTSLVYKQLMKTKNYNVSFLVIASTLGELTYIFLYILKSFIQQKYIIGLQGVALGTVLIAKLSASAFNAVISIIVACIIYHFIKDKINL